jgi:hypothetical protein
MKNVAEAIIGLTVIGAVGLVSPGATASTQVAPPSVARNSPLTSVELVEVDCVSPAVCFGVGTHRYTESFTFPGNPDEQVIVADRPIVFTKTASGWNEMSFPAIPQDLSGPGPMRMAAEMQSISCTSSGTTVTKTSTYCVAVGRYFGWYPDGLDSVEYGPLTAVWNGQRWKLVGGPLPTDTIRVWDTRSSVQCVRAKQCYSLASYAMPRGDKQGLATWDGRSWSFKKVTRPVSRSGFSDLSCWAPRRCVAVGGRQGAASDSSQPLLMELAGRRWTTHEARSAKSGLSAVDCLSASWCVATGRNVSVIKRAGAQRWRVMPMRGNKTYFTGLSCTAARSCLAVGATSGRPVRPSAQTFDGRRWDSATPPGTRSLSDVDCASKTSCVALGQQVLMDWKGRSWTRRSVSVRPYTSPPA